MFARYGAANKRLTSSGVPPALLPSPLFSSGYGGLALSVEGPSKVDINCEDMEDGTCKVSYTPTEPGNYVVNIKFADKHIPGETACLAVSQSSFMFPLAFC